MASLRARFAIAVIRRYFKPVWENHDPALFKSGNAWIDNMIGGRGWGVRVTAATLGDRPAMAFAPKKGPADRHILYFHGGGFVVHMPDMYRKFVARLCRLLGATAAVPDYRLAPAHPFPAAFDDCLAAYRATIAGGIDSKNLVVIGDSAGGHLTFGVLMAARDEGLPMPACAVTFSPATSFAEPLGSEAENSERDPLISEATLHWLRGQYLQGADPHDFRASPLFGENRGLPPVRIDVGGIETLRDHGIAIAAKIREGGGRAKIKTWPGMPHVFPTLDGIPESRACLEEVAAFVDRHIPR